MLWLKAFHIISMVSWFAGLFYLPRLYVYHASSENPSTIDTFKRMEWKLYFYIMTPSALLAILFGWGIIFTNYEYYSHLMWLHVKLTLVLTLVIYHGYLGILLFDFKKGLNTHSHRFYRWLNEYPTLILICIVILTIVKPWVTD
jgi:putative membrane protein